MQELTSHSVESAHVSDKSIASLVALHERDARAAVRRVLGRSQEEDDLVQEVFVRLVIRLRQPGEVQVGAWVRGVAHNLAVDEIRRRRAVPVEQTHLDAPVPSAADEQLDGVELYSNLVAGAKCLPDRQRAALAAVLSAEGRLGVAGVATQLGVSVHAAESLISRARTGLRHHLATAGASSDAGSVRVGPGGILGVLALVSAWIGRHWRAVALAGAVAAGSVTTVVSLPGHPAGTRPQASSTGAHRASQSGVVAAEPAPDSTTTPDEGVGTEQATSPTAPATAPGGDAAAAGGGDTQAVAVAVAGPGSDVVGEPLCATVTGMVPSGDLAPGPVGRVVGQVERPLPDPCAAATTGQAMVGQIH